MPIENCDRDPEQDNERPRTYIEYLRREIAIGMEQSRRGESTPLDMTAVKQEVRESAGTHHH